MVFDAQTLPTTMQNLRAAKRWRPADMVNWHRIVSPLRANASEDLELNLFRLVVNVCTRMSFQYDPHPFTHDSCPAPFQPEADAYTGPRIALFVDAAHHLSGVAHTLSHWQRESRLAGAELRMHSASPQPTGGPVVLFQATGTFRVAMYDGLELPVPLMRSVMAYMQQSRFDVVHLSTPGPVGLAGLVAARSLGLPVVGTFHTHFPAYTRRLTGDAALEAVTWDLMRWFYAQLDLVAAPSASVRQELIDQGCRPHRVHVVGRGVDAALFHPSRRTEQWREALGNPKHLLLYVGRVSREKNLPCLADAWPRLAAMNPDAALLIVGDGPYRAEMQAKLTGQRVHFAGVLRGEDLARAYASADLMVFPSETDTLGNVVLEAQASGVPVVVSSKGGPKDCIRDGETGFVLPAISPGSLANTLAALLTAPERLDAMREPARSHALGFTHAASFAAFLDLHRRALDPALRSRM